jgi:hypothetical protein
MKNEKLRMKIYGNQKHYLLSFITAAVVLVLTGYFTPSLATEGGGGAYSNGADDFNIGKMPPAGTYFFNYFNYHYADKLKDNGGHTIPVDFSFNSIGNGFRLFYVSGNKFLGADMGMYIVLPVADVNVKFIERSQSKSGLADMAVNPFVLGWHFTDWHFGAGTDIKAPTGSYSKVDLANIGRNYWTFEPIFAFTYLNTDGYEVSAKLMYDFNTENNATEYLSGQEFHVDYTLGKKIDNFNIGIGGYYYKQLTDDKRNDAKVENYKGQVFAAGPQFRYNYKYMAFILKYQLETLVKNRAEGENFWFKYIYRF